MTDEEESQLALGERKACQTCAVAKAKCILPTTNLAGDIKCERCARLNKPCNPQPTPVRKVRPQKKTVPRGVQLERKLDDIAQLLAARSSQDGPESSKSPERHEPAQQANNPLPHVWIRRQMPSLTRSQMQWQTDESHTASNLFDKQAMPNVKLTYQEMEEAIDVWRPQLALHFPFAALSDSQSTKMLMIEKPFMSIAIAVAALYGDLPRQLGLAEGLIKDIGRAMLSEGQKSLDLLQGILVLIAWYHYHVYKNPQTSNLMHLAAALLVDLGLNRPRDRFRAQKASYFFQQFVHGPKVITEVRNLPERRALAGCYYMSSVIWCTFKRLDPIPYTDHVHDAISQLDQAQELPSDRLLVWLVRAQLLYETMERDLDIEHTLRISSSIGPAETYVEKYTKQLEAFSEKLPADMKNNTYVKLVLYCARITMYESAFTFIDAVPLSRTPDTAHRAARRREYLLECVRTIRTFETVFHREISPAEYYSQAFDLWARNSIPILILARIFLRKDCRDLEPEINAIVNFEEMLERYATYQEEACATARYHGLPLGDNHLFERWAHHLRIYKESNKHVHDPWHLPRANAQATFPGDDSSMPMDAAAMSRTSQAAAEARTRVAQEFSTEEGEGMEVDEGGMPSWAASMVDFNERTAVQCPMS